MPPFSGKIPTASIFKTAILNMKMVGLSEKLIPTYHITRHIYMYNVLLQLLSLTDQLSSRSDNTCLYWGGSR